MTITRPHVCELDIAGAEIDDHGRVLVSLYTNSGTILARELTAAEARELAAEITTAAAEADAYAAERQTRP